MAWCIYLVALFIAYVSSDASMECSGSMRLDIPYAKMEELLVKMEAQADVIQSIKTEQNNMKRDHDDLKDYILKRLDAIDEKTEWFLTKGQQGVHPLSERMSRIEATLNETVKMEDVIQTIKTGQDNMMRDYDDLKENILEKMYAIDDRTKVILTQGIEAIMNRTVIFKDCQERYDQGFKKSGVFPISVAGTPRDVYCEQDLDGGGWTVFQSRKDGSVDFYREWADYKRGFGNPSGEFWLGNEFIHLLTKDHDQELKIELKYNARTAYADYSSFWIEDESEWYKLNVSGFSGAYPPGDKLWYHNGMNFTTKDRDNDQGIKYNCARDLHGAWWFKSCNHSNLNGRYGSPNGYKTLTWGSGIRPTGTRMMVKKRN